MVGGLCVLLYNLGGNIKMDRHFTVSVFIVHKDKVLLHLHKKAKKILPLGGHIEVNELPEEACIREAKEESGLEINLNHYHIDFVYYATTESFETMPADGESNL